MRPPGSILMVAALWARRATGAYDEKLCNEGTYDSPDTGFTCKSRVQVLLEKQTGANGDSRCSECMERRGQRVCMHIGQCLSSTPSHRRLQLGLTRGHGSRSGTPRRPLTRLGGGRRIQGLSTPTPT